MKIMLNGATGGTNFGDYLFAEIFQNEVASLVGEENVYWYQSRYSMSDFYCRHLHYDRRRCRLSEIDALVSISGGYFCGADHGFRDYLIRYLRYFRLSLQCIRRKIPIAILGVEVAASKSRWLDRVQRYILTHAEVVTVRNEESLRQLQAYGVQNGILTADTAHTVRETLRVGGPADKADAHAGKKLFFHVQYNQLAVAKRQIEALNLFLAQHPEYTVYIGADQYVPDEAQRLSDLAALIKANSIKTVPFDDPKDLCRTLSQMDFIVTPKLHVGIVGATYGKSVVSFSVHSEKIGRFYKQLHEEGRSLPMSAFTVEKAVSMMDTYCSTPMRVPEKITELAYENVRILRDFIKSLSGDHQGDKHEIKE